ncbi:hypothetical protein SCUP515_03374 [Seiridium cupressi]
MAPVQQTFSLIPELPSALNGDGEPRVSRPPMTTKQVKKAYKARNKGPKLSKAEQRRQDLMEQDRIRREFEKERNQVRARAARDKRKEKEEREKSEKKKKGLPLVEVHPSQDTLARFLRKPKSPKAQDDPTVGMRRSQTRPIESGIQDTRQLSNVFPGGDDGDKALSDGNELKRPAKRQRVGASPQISSAVDCVPDDMFKKAKRGLVSEAVDIALEPHRDAGKDSVEDPALETGSFDPDDPAVENMVNQQILKESFSADDGLFDDIDIDAIDAKIVARETAPAEKEAPPPKPPDRPLLSIEHRIEVQGHPRGNDGTVASRKGAASARADPFYHQNTDNTVCANFTVQPNESGRDQAGFSVLNRKSNTEEKHDPDPHNNWRQPNGSSQANNRDQNKLVREEVDHSRTTVTGFPKFVEKADDRPLPSCHARSTHVVGANASKHSRGLLIAAERQSRKPVRELALNENMNLRSNCVGQRPAAPTVEESLPDKTPKALVWKSPATFSGSGSFRSPRTPVMGPPALPPKFRVSAHSTSNNDVRGPRFLPQQRQSPVVQRAEPGMSTASIASPVQSPPSNTQLFLLSNADELFPSPSQEVAEIFERSNDGVQYPPIRPKTAPSPPQFVPPPRCGRPKTATNVPHTLTSRPTGNSLLTQRQDAQRRASVHMAGHMPPLIGSHVPATTDIDVVPFLSTQDILLSSQDLMELGKETLTSTKPLQPSPGCLRMNHASDAHHLAHAISQHQRDNDVVTPMSKHCATTPNGKMTTRTSHAVSTHNRTFGLNHQSQPSSSLPDTPSGPYPREKSPLYNNIHTPEHPVQGLGRDKGPAINGSPFTDEEIAELIDADSEVDEDMPGRTRRATASQAVVQQTPAIMQSSPKPFFTSSGTKEKLYLAIERTRTTASRDKHAHLQAEEDLYILLRQEDERQERILLEKMLEAEEKTAQQTELKPLYNDRIDGSVCSSPRTKSGDGKSHSQKSRTGSESSRRRSQPQSSFEKMLEMLEKSKGGEEVIRASQESDYGDIAWDADDLLDL